MKGMEDEVIEEFIRRLQADDDIPTSLARRIGEKLRASRVPKEDTLQRIIEEELRNAD